MVEGAFVDVLAVVADGDAHVDAEVVAAGFRGDVEQGQVAVGVECFVEVEVQRGAAVQPVNEFAAVQEEFVECVGFVVFNDVEVGVVAVARDLVAVGFVPFGVFDAEVFGGDEFGVEAYAVLLRGAFVEVVDGFQACLHEVYVFGVVAYVDALCFGGFGHAVDADGEELFVEADVAGVVYGEHAGCEVVFHEFAVGELVAVDFADFFGEVAAVLFEAVHVDGDDVDGAGGDAACAQGVGEGAVFYFVAQAAAGGKRVGVVGEVDEE